MFTSVVVFLWNGLLGVGGVAFCLLFGLLFVFGLLVIDLWVIFGVTFVFGVCLCLLGWLFVYFFACLVALLICIC